MKRSFQVELMVFTAVISGLILFSFLGVAWWLVEQQFRRSVDGKMEIPGERLLSMLGEEGDLLEVILEYTDRAAEHEFHFVVYDNLGKHWYTSPDSDWLEQVSPDPFLPSFEQLERLPSLMWDGRRRSGPPGGPGGRRGPPGRPEGSLGGRLPIAPMVFRAHEQPDGSEWRLGGISNRDVTVIMALKLSDFDDELHRARNGFLLAIPVALIALAGGGWVVSQRAIRPLRRIATTASHLSVQELSHRIEYTGNEPAEVAELIDVLNEMMSRLERGFSQARRFAADASHELKTPIALVQNGIESALEACHESNEDPALLMAIASEVRRLKGILEGLLLLSRADAGELRLVDEVVDLSAEVSLFCEDLEVLTEPDRIQTEISIATGIRVLGDRILLGQAIQNLLSNAVKYTEPNGRVWCSLSQQEGMALFEVGNSGPGIPEEDAARIFDRFYRVDKARSRKLDGVGLGLNIVLEIVRAHRGELILARADAEATVFQMGLPLEEDGVGSSDA